jgi:hypothetical protein
MTFLYCIVLPYLVTKRIFNQHAQTSSPDTMSSAASLAVLVDSLHTRSLVVTALVYESIILRPLANGDVIRVLPFLQLEVVLPCSSLLHGR